MTRLGQKSASYERWPPILVRAAEIVNAIFAETGIRITLRRLFYKLVGEGRIRNHLTHYKRLATLTAKGRREGTFPDLAQDQPAITQPFTVASVKACLQWDAHYAELDHSATQTRNIMIACEKAGTIPFLKLWFHDQQHIRIIALGGETSTPTWQEVKKYIRRDGRKPLVLYLSDYDASGYAIRSRFKVLLGLRDDEFIHIGLLKAQVARYRLIRNPGKDLAPKKDRDAFRRETGETVQVELDALDEHVLRTIVTKALAPYWDETRYQQQLRKERRMRRRLQALAHAER